MGSRTALPARYFLHDLVTGGTPHNGSRHLPPFPFSLKEQHSSKTNPGDYRTNKVNSPTGTKKQRMGLWKPLGKERAGKVERWR